MKLLMSSLGFVANFFKYNPVVLIVKDCSIWETHVEPVYQPIVDLETGSVCGAEVFLHIGDIINEKNTNGLTYVLKNETCATESVFCLLDKVEKHFQGVKLRTKFTLVINTYSTEMQNQEIINSLIKLRENTPYTIKIQLVIGSQNLNDISDNVLDMIELLKKLDIEVSMDVFGLDMCSLKYMSHLKLDTLIIDETTTIFHNKKLVYENFISTLCILSSIMGFMITAEGVDTEEQAHSLMILGVSSQQGTLYDNPQSFNDFKNNHLLQIMH